MYYKNKHFKFKILLILIFIFSIIFTSNVVYAKDYQYVIPGGDAIGLKLDTGVYVAGKYQVSTNNIKVSPWKHSNIEEGDLILSCDGISVSRISDLNRLIQNTEKSNINLEIQRNNNILSTSIDIVKTINGEQTIGLYVKDRLIGIGTLTFINPENNTFASLGHGISDKALVFGKVNGDVVNSNIEGIKKGIPGTSGEKRASLMHTKIGYITKNSLTGVYGVIDVVPKRKTLPIASQKEVKKGFAQILTVVSGNKIEMFDIEVLSVTHQDCVGVKGIKFKVTDNDLLNVAGGIVQGMSGSPIIQNNMIIGAVSHVSLEDPKIGYAMHIEWMLEETNNII